MNETDFQELYASYERSEEGSNERQSCLNTLHHHIYQYPARRFRTDADKAAEFYAYYYGKIDSLFKEYDPSQQISFLTFLSVKLKFAYFRFLSKNRQVTADFKDWNDELTIAPEPEAASGLWAEVKALLMNIINSLALDDEMRIRLYYGFPLKLSHFRELLKRRIGLRIFQMYREYLVAVNKYNFDQQQEKERLLGRLSELDADEARRLRQRLIKRFFKITSPISLRTISKMLDETVSTLHRRITRTVEMIREKIVENIPYFKLGA